ncbi:UDP-N-acetylmuramoyl-tripeptide--D-alanyl-D-alanine ligase [Thermoproteota archaeon]
MVISIDTRTIQPGDTFIPVKGQNYNGRDFIPEAIKKGAKVLDVDITDYAKKYRKKLNCQVIAVTGSAGKTTVKDMLSSVLSTRFNVVKTNENQNNEIGVPLTILQADGDTDILIVELAMRAKGEISHLTRIIRPTHVVVTGIGFTHIEMFKKQRDIALAKAEIFRKPLVWEKKNRNAYINISSAFSKIMMMKAKAKGYQVFPYSGDEKPDQNMNVCFLMGRHFGLTDEEIRKGISNYKGSSHRLEVSHCKGITIIDDTYNANPDGVAYALQYLRRFQGRKLFIMGDMKELGSYAKQMHQKIAEEAVDAGVSLLYTYGEESACISSPFITVYNFLDKSKLNNIVVSELKKGDVVMVKGSRGMRMEETVDAIRRSLE